MKKKRKIILKKIYLKDFIEILLDIYERGADYIDITGTTNPDQDTLGIQVMNDYLRKDDGEGVPKNDKLTDDLINLL